MATDLFSTDPEVAVISLVTKNPELAFSLDGLKHYMFSSQPLSFLFKEIESMIEKQLTPDVAMLVTSLESRGELEKYGGKRFIESVLSKDFSKTNFVEYVNLVIASYKAKRLISTTAGISPDTINSGNIDDVIAGVRESLDSLSEVVRGEDVVHVGDVVKDAYSEIASRVGSPGIRGISWGLADIDAVSGGKSGGEYWIISGRPGSGKSAFMCNSFLSDIQSGNPVLVIEREMRKQELIERMLSIKTGIPLTNIRFGILNQEQLDTVHGGLRDMKDYPLYLDTSYSYDLQYLEAMITKHKRLHDIKVVYIDYVQLLSTRDDNQTAELGRLSRMFKILANKHDICFVVLSQLNRGVEGREDKRPLMSDLRQSGNLEEDADFIVGLYRDEYYNRETNHKGIMEFIIQKARNGPVGTLSLKFNAETNKIVNLK